VSPKSKFLTEQEEANPYRADRSRSWNILTARI
jgi:hypothetical protein